MNGWRTTAEWDWVWVGNGNRLHAVATLTNDADEDWYGKGMTECGLVTDYMHIPGIFSRMSAPRCKHCCAKVGMPQGNQSPKNVDECRPIVEARIARLEDDKMTDKTVELEFGNLWHQGRVPIEVPTQDCGEVRCTT